ncbi:hypothetical protein M3Y96_00372700 [Aphelenchoides besseyi]|nr:hypothetical protein M3Y96_00372700 [Aphelenchoides besseyi]
MIVCIKALELLHTLRKSVFSKARPGLETKMKFQIVLLLLAALVSLFAPVNSRPTNSMTRIQDVFRTLMGPGNRNVAQRGKKSVIYSRPITDENGNGFRYLYLVNRGVPELEDE